MFRLLFVIILIIIVLLIFAFVLGISSPVQQLRVLYLFTLFIHYHRPGIVIAKLVVAIIFTAKQIIIIVVVVLLLTFLFFLVICMVEFLEFEHLLPDFGSSLVSLVHLRGKRDDLSLALLGINDQT